MKFVQQGSFASCNNQLIFQAAFLSELDSCSPPDWQKCLIETPFLQRQRYLKIKEDSHHPVKRQHQPSFESQCQSLLRTERKSVFLCNVLSMPDVVFG